MNLKSFYKKDDTICYKKLNMIFQIRPSEYKDTLHLGITCNKKGFLPMLLGYLLILFLKKNFFQLQITRLHYLFLPKKELVISKQIERKGYQYYTSELLVCLFLIAGLVLVYKEISFIPIICIAIALLINIYSAVFSLYKMYDYSRSGNYTSHNMHNLITKIAVSLTLLAFSYVFSLLFFNIITVS